MRRRGDPRAKRRQALQRAWGMSREKHEIRDADAFEHGGKQQGPAREGKDRSHPARSKAQARGERSSAREPGDLLSALEGGSPTEPVREAERRKLCRRQEESDSSVVPGNAPNEAKAEEGREGRELANGKALQNGPPRTRSRMIGGQTVLQRLGEQARRQKEKGAEKFTNLMTHLRADLMKEVFYRLKKKAAPGADGQTWAEYEQGLDERLTELQGRLHREAYKPQPVLRRYIPKADGRKRPLGIPAIEDKVVQGTVVALLTPVYEAEFLDCSYGFRPRRGAHDALEAVDGMMYRGKVDWVLDADISAYFDNISHEWLLKFLGHRIGDKRLLRLIARWLKAGVLVDGRLEPTEEGTPQGGLISPLLANVYLHYVLDLWFAHEKRSLRGTAHLVRYADDFIVGFQRRDEAESFLARLRERFSKFGLTLHADKTRLIRFGKFARRDSPRDGRSRPETFDFLGFTHISEENREGGYLLVRRTSRRRRQSRRQALKQGMKERRSWRLKDQWEWLSAALRGHYAYFGVTTNYPALAAFRHQVWLDWHRSLMKRSQRAHLSRRQLDALDQHLPLPRPYLRHRNPMLPFGAP